MVRAVIFDCFGVLIGDAYMVIRNKYSEVAAEVIELNRRSSLGLITSEEKKTQVELLLSSLGLDGKMAVAEAVDDIQRNTEILKTIKDLRGRFKVGLLSNVGVGFWKRFSEDEIKEYFDDVVLSYQVGLAKPDVRIFELAADRLGVAPEECIFVDDDETNVYGAESVGMKGILYKWGMDIEQKINELAE